jgi:hypothetical protein
LSAIALDPLIAEAKRRARRRYLIALAMAVGALGVVAGWSIAHSDRLSSLPPSVSIPVRATGVGCGVRGVGARILSPEGRTLYREPATPMMGFPAIQCSGSTIWAVWFNGVGMSQQAYFGARSSDSGRTWRPVFTENYFALKAPHALDSYFGVWTLRGPFRAYFVGSCPACSDATAQGTIALYVTSDGGRTFHKYDVPTLTGYTVTRIAVHGESVTLRAKRFARGVEPPRKTVTIHTA